MTGLGGSTLRLLVVSHPAVLAVNQLPYAAMRGHGWEPFVIAPRAWRNEYTPGAFPPEVLPELTGRVVGRRVILPGRIQRHVYLTRIAKVIADVQPHAAFVEEEPTSAAAFQWGRALHGAGIPFGLQADENLDRRWPPPARAFRRWSLRHAAFVAARSPAAARLLNRLCPGVPAPVIPHHVPDWPSRDAAQRDRFVIGYAGRLVEAKGLDVMIDAAAGLDGVAVALVGNGPSRGALEARARGAGVDLEVDGRVRHEDMADAYSGFDVLVLPSRTTPTWVEQFGRVLVEALWCGVPVVGSDSGEIPWVIRSTGGGLVFAEGDRDGLRRALIRLRDRPELRRELARRGRERVRALFSVEAVARHLDRSLREAAGLEGAGSDGRARGYASASVTELHVSPSAAGSQARR
jgi:glycosyltransferase involved in cell wall biosynthesis